MLQKFITHVRGNVVAYAALFVALGGTALGAAALAPNSVGTKQLKDDAVISVKVKDGSLLAKDFAAGQLPRGPAGPRGFTGATGKVGAAGRDGAAIVVRPGSTSSVNTPADHSSVSIPLASRTWTQKAGEVDFGPFGRITYTAPSSSDCGGTGSADLGVTIYIDGKTFSVTNINTPRDGGTRTEMFQASQYLFEPGRPVSHTATVTASSVCESGPFPAPFTVKAVRFDIIRAS